jgi:hypothetical protein
MTKKEIRDKFFDVMLETQYHIKWVLDADNDKVMANRIGVLPRWTKAFILDNLMPVSVRQSLNKKYPGRMEIL